MDADEEALTGAKRKRVGLFVLVAIPFVLAMAGGVAFFLSKRADAQKVVLIENITGAAFGCVASIRGDAPETWSLERALEHMSRMEQVTTDQTDPTHREERERFAQIATDASIGCEDLGRRMLEARREAPDLYFGVPAVLAQQSDPDNPGIWYRRVIPDSREDTVTLTRQIQAMADAIGRLRQERQMMVTQLPIGGTETSELARVIDLGSLPRDRESVRGFAWPMSDAVLVLRRGSIGNVPCQMRFMSRASCYNEFVQRVSWTGEVSPLQTLVRPANVTFWSNFTVTPDGSIWAVGRASRGGIVGRYPPGALEPETAEVDAEVDGATNVVSVAGGVAVFPADGSAWFTANDALSFERVETTPPPVGLLARNGAEAGLSMPGVGRLSIFGSEDVGWTTRFEPEDEGEEDVLRRVIDAHRQVSAIGELRSLQSGKAVALLQRTADGPDALILTTDFGRTWLSASPSTD